MESNSKQISSLNCKRSIYIYCCHCCSYSRSHPQNQEQKNQQLYQTQHMHIEKHTSFPTWLITNTTQSSDFLCSCCRCTHSEKDNNSNVISSSEPVKFTIQTNYKPQPNSNEIVFSEAKKLSTKKYHAIEELLQTERDYVKDLNYLVEVLLYALNRQTWITKEHRSIISRNSREILEFHKQFIIHYDTKFVHDNNWSFIARSFLDQIKQFSIYKNYCDLHAEAWTITSDYQNRSEWASFLKDCSLTRSNSVPLDLNNPTVYNKNELSYQQQQKKLHFEDYLIKPVQRICRYQLLIREIIRYTSSETTEYKLWNEVLNELQSIVTEIDDRKLQREIKKQTEKFIDRLDEDWRINKGLVAQLGNILISGAIEITYSALGQSLSKSRYLGCFIFQTYIIIVKPKKITSYEPKYWFPLRMADFEDLPNNEVQKDYSFIIRCKKHTFSFNASCSQEKQTWVKKIQEAIVAAKIEASDENMSAQDFIVSSLPGITSKRSPQSIRLSRSFTNMLDMAITGSSKQFTTNYRHMSSLDRIQLRRSASMSIRFDDIMKLSAQENFPISSEKKIQPRLKKRYSADCYNFNHDNLGPGSQKMRDNSEMHLKNELSTMGPNRRRPSSLDILTVTNNSNNMIGKMSLQLKHNHRNSIRLTVDNKLHDVSTQDYLSSKALYKRDRDNSSFSFDTLTSNHTSNCNTVYSGNVSNAGIYNDFIQRRKSSSFLRSSASNFSLIPKRLSESKQSNHTMQKKAQTQIDYDAKHYASSSINIKSHSFIDTENKKDQVNILDKKQRSHSVQLLDHLVQNQGHINKSSILFGTKDHPTKKSLGVNRTIERTPSRSKIAVGKILKRITSFQKKPASSSPIDTKSSFEYVVKVNKTTSKDNKNSNTKRKTHEESNQVPLNDRPKFSVDCEEFLKPLIPISVFAYASTPPPSTSPTKKKNEGSKWKNRLNLMNPTFFLKFNYGGDKTAFN